MDRVLVLTQLFFHADDDIAYLFDFGPQQMDEFGLLLNQ